jgi:SAM-dependent methyltransferase
VLSSDRARAESFGADALQYDRARPSYPKELVDALVAGRAGLSVLDVGCGTGICAGLFAAAGCSVLGVEPDARMAAVARAHGLAVEESAFERFEAAGRTFDLVTCAQAWHWVDPVAGTEKAASVLGEGGRIALIWNEGVHDPEVASVIDAVYARHTGRRLDDYSVLLGHGATGQTDAGAAAIRAGGHFGEPAVSAFPWERTYTRDEWLDQLPTHSDHRSLPAERLAALLGAVGDAIDEAGGHIAVHYTAWLVSAARLGA